MKKFRRIAALAVAATMVAAAFAGCSSTGATKNDGEKKFYIGGIGPTTGAAASYGENVKEGAQIAVDEINAAGGINGYKIEYKFEDDTHNAETSVNAYNSLKDWGMQILMGTVTTAPCLAVVEKTAADGMFQITPSASSADVIKNDNVFQICFTDPNQGSASAQYFAENDLGKNIGVIYDSSDPYSSGIYETFSAKATELGLNVVTVQSFTSDTKSEFSAQVKACKDANCDLVFLPFYYTEAALVLTEADKEGFKPVFFGVDGMDGVLGVEGFDTALAEGVYLLTPFSADAEDDLTKKFVSTFDKDYSAVPTQFAADAYDAIYVIKAAIEKANVTPDSSVSEIGAALKDAMTQIEVTGLTGKMTWDASGAVTKSPMAVVIKDGVYVSAK